MITISVNVPKAWHELSQLQLRFLLQTIVKVQVENRHVGFRSLEDAQAQTVAQISTMCFFEWAAFKVICRYADGYLVLHGEDEVKITSEQIAAAIKHLEWTKEIPQTPVRLDTVDGAQAVRADIAEGFPFDNWLSCEALWQGYLATETEECLRQMAAILYRKPDIKPDKAELLGVFYWWASVKALMSMLFPHFFQPSASPEAAEPTQDDIRRNMDAQIRALTKGDITKESTILALETMRALTELDALAREYDELNRKYPHR